MKLNISDENVSLIIDPLYVTEEKWVCVDVSIQIESVSFSESIELHCRDFESLYDLFKNIDNDSSQKWESMEEKMFIELNRSEHDCTFNVTYNIGDCRENFIHAKITLHESDIQDVVSQLFSIIKWMN